METVELLVFIIAGFMLGGLLLAHFLDIPYFDILQETGRPFEPPDLAFSMTESELEEAAFEVYDRCGLGLVNQTTHLYFNEDDEYQREDILEKAFKNNHPELNDETLTMPDEIQGPAVITFHCERGILTIK